MKVLVGIKRVVDYAVKVRVNKGTVDLSSVKQSMNPFCEVCVCVCVRVRARHVCVWLQSTFVQRRCG